MSGSRWPARDVAIPFKSLATPEADLLSALGQRLAFVLGLSVLAALLFWTHALNIEIGDLKTLKFEGATAFLIGGFFGLAERALSDFRREASGFVRVRARRLTAVAFGAGRPACRQAAARQKGLPMPLTPEWATFFSAKLAALATLTGLVVVAISINSAANSVLGLFADSRRRGADRPRRRDHSDEPRARAGAASLVVGRPGHSDRPCAGFPGARLARPEGQVGADTCGRSA